jgi:hypothetical protein
VRVETELARATIFFVTNDPEVSAVASVTGTVAPHSLLLESAFIAGNFRTPASYCYEV